MESIQPMFTSTMMLDVNIMNKKLCFFNGFNCAALWEIISRQFHIKTTGQSNSGCDIIQMKILVTVVSDVSSVICNFFANQPPLLCMHATVGYLFTPCTIQTGNLMKFRTMLLGVWP
jgi:hypothetical protein